MNYTWMVKKDIVLYTIYEEKICYSKFYLFFGFPNICCTNNTLIYGNCVKK